MIKKIKNYLMSSLMVVSMAAPVPVFATAVVAAAPSPVKCNTISQGIADGATQVAGDVNAKTGSCDGAGVDGDSIGVAAAKLVRVFSLVVGIAAIIMIIYGGFRYITSGGDSSRVGNAKNTLIYAIIGLVVVALAQLIVQFVLNQSTNITTGTS